MPNVILLPVRTAILEALGARLGAAARAHVVLSLAEAVALAARLTPRGSTVLFSPASPSYGLYKNFEERGNVFRGLVDAL